MQPGYPRLFAKLATSFKTRKFDGIQNVSKTWWYYGDIPTISFLPAERTDFHGAALLWNIQTQTHLAHRCPKQLPAISQLPLEHRSKTPVAFSFHGATLQKTYIIYRETRSKMGKEPTIGFITRSKYSNQTSCHGNLALPIASPNSMDFPCWVAWLGCSYSLPAPPLRRHGDQSFVLDLCAASWGQTRTGRHGGIEATLPGARPVFHQQVGC